MYIGKGCEAGMLCRPILRVEIDVGSLVLLLLLLAWRFRPDMLAACFACIKRCFGGGAAAEQVESPSVAATTPECSDCEVDSDLESVYTDDDPRLAELIKIATRAGANDVALVLNYMWRRGDIDDTRIGDDGFIPFVKWVAGYSSDNPELLAKSRAAHRLKGVHSSGNPWIDFKPLVLALTRDDPEQRASVLRALNIDDTHAKEQDKFFERNTDAMRPLEKDTFMEDLLPQGGVIDIGHPWPQPSDTGFDPSAVFDDVPMHKDVTGERDEPWEGHTIGEHANEWPSTTGVPQETLAMEPLDIDFEMHSDASPAEGVTAALQGALDTGCRSPDTLLLELKNCGPIESPGQDVIGLCDRVWTMIKANDTVPIQLKSDIANRMQHLCKNDAWRAPK